MHIIIYFFITPGSHWYYRLQREWELLLFLVNNFIFDSKSLVQICQQVQSKQKSTFNYIMLLKIVTDFEILAKTIENSLKYDTLFGKSVLKKLKTLELIFDALIFEKSLKEKQRKLGNFLNDPTKLNHIIHPKDKIWQGNEKLLAEIEKYSISLQVF